jgi:hypothetical protein
MEKNILVKTLAGFLFLIYMFFFVMVWKGNFTSFQIIFLALLNISCVTNAVLFFIAKEQKKPVVFATISVGLLMIFEAKVNFTVFDLFFWAGIMMGCVFIILSIFFLFFGTE